MDSPRLLEGSSFIGPTHGFYLLVLAHLGLHLFYKFHVNLLVQLVDPCLPLDSFQLFLDGLLNRLIAGSPGFVLEVAALLQFLH